MSDTASQIWSTLRALPAVASVDRLLRRHFGLALDLAGVADGAAVSAGGLWPSRPTRAGALRCASVADAVPSGAARPLIDDLLALAASCIDAYLDSAGDAPSGATIPSGISPARHVVARVSDEMDENVHPDQKNTHQRQGYADIIGASPPMQELFSVLARVVQSDTTVLVQGENGTGKELVARAVHYQSPRAAQRFVVTNCSAFNDSLLDSELFGHVKGAFTGAVVDKRGLFEVADRGTFFLDEIGDMSPALQVKVLRVLQEGTFTPVGSTETRRVDVRIIAATNRDLRAMVAEGSFREDLYYRVNVINLHIPPLRERPGDLELLAAHFLAAHARGGRQPALSSACLARMRAYTWPGNVRELENEIARLVVLADDDEPIPASLLSPRVRAPQESAPVAELPAEQRTLPEALRALEERMIREALERNEWNKTRTARALDISRRNLIRLVAKYELEAKRKS